MTFRLPPHRGGYRPKAPSQPVTERPQPPRGPGGGSHRRSTTLRARLVRALLAQPSEGTEGGA